jgi:hypothetical protein
MISGRRDGWNPYVAGALAGVLAVGSAWATTQVLGKTTLLGASTTFVRAAGLIERAVAPDHVAQNAYFTKEKVKVDWQFLFVLGILLGAFAASLTDRSFKLEAVPPAWAERFGPGIGRRALAALGGGAVAMIGARLADGCPSGHGLSGLMQLFVSGFAALGIFFLSGIAVARAVYGGRRHG